MMRILLLAAFLALGGCSTFDADYKALAHTSVSMNSFVEGAWDGTWESSKGQGSGRLQAVITRDHAKLTSMQNTLASGTYDARFKATWSRVLTSEYAVPLNAATDLRQVQTVTIHVEHDLGVGAGHYTMDGQATATSITATYKSDLDEGTIELHRPHDEDGK